MEYRILIVDSDAATRRRYAEALIAMTPAAGVSYRINTVNSVKAAQMQAARHRFHLLIASLGAGWVTAQIVEWLPDVYQSDIQILLIHDAPLSHEQLDSIQQFNVTFAEQPIAAETLRNTIATLLGLRSIPNVNTTTVPLAGPPETQSHMALAGGGESLNDVRQETHATLALYADAAGTIIARNGDASGVDVASCAALLADHFLHSATLGRILHDAETSHVMVHEGHLFDLYAASVGGHGLLILLFNKMRVQPQHDHIWRTIKQNAVQLARVQLPARPVDEALSMQVPFSLHTEFEHLFADELAKRER